MRIYGLLINDDTLNQEQRDLLEKKEFEYDDYNQGYYRRVYYYPCNSKEEAFDILESLGEMENVDWILKSFDDMPD